MTLTATPALHTTDTLVFNEGFDPGQTITSYAFDVTYLPSDANHVKFEIVIKLS